MSGITPNESVIYIFTINNNPENYYHWTNRTQNLKTPHKNAPTKIPHQNTASKKTTPHLQTHYWPNRPITDPKPLETGLFNLVEIDHPPKPTSPSPSSHPLKQI